MRLLHTADWHLGQRFHDQRRGDDEQHALDQLLELAAEHRIDAFLLAGDIFDTANPGAEEQRRYYRFLFKLVTEVGVPTVVVTGGNHDSALRLDGPKDLLADLGIQVVGRWPRDTPPEHCLVELKDRQGQTGAICAAVPYLRDGDLRLPPIGETAPQIHARYAKALENRYLQVREAAGEAYPGLSLVVMGHCYVDDALIGGGERPVQVGNLAKVRVQVLGEDAAYLALGHLHRPQSLGGQDHWRYCGSLLPTGFDEVERQREVLRIDLPDDGAPGQVISLPLAPYREYRRLHGTPDQLEAVLADLEPPAEGVPTPWAEASVVLEGPRPGFAQRLIDSARDRGWDLISVKRHRPPTESTERPVDGEVLGLKELDPEEVFIERHRREFDCDPDDELLTEFRSLLAAVTSGESSP